MQDPARKYVKTKKKRKNSLVEGEISWSGRPGQIMSELSIHSFGQDRWEPGGKASLWIEIFFELEMWLDIKSATTYSLGGLPAAVPTPINRSYGTKTT